MENKRNNDVIEIDLFEIFHHLLNYIGYILGVGLFCALLGFALSNFIIAPSYESTTKIYILNKSDNAAVTYSDVQLGTQLTKDYAELISSRYVLEEVIQTLGLTLNYEELSEKITVTTPSDTRIVAITVKDHDAITAMNIANAVRESASAHIQNVMDIEAVNIVETANMPTEKASPSVRNWTLIFGFIGVLIVCGIAFIQCLMDDTIKSSEDVEKYLGLSTLAIIPLSQEESSARKKKNKRR